MYQQPKFSAPPLGEGPPSVEIAESHGAQEFK